MQDIIYYTEVKKWGGKDTIIFYLKSNPKECIGFIELLSSNHSLVSG